MLRNGRHFIPLQARLCFYHGWGSTLRVSFLLRVKGPGLRQSFATHRVTQLLRLLMMLLQGRRDHRDIMSSKQQTYRFSYCSRSSPLSTDPELILQFRLDVILWTRPQFLDGSVQAFQDYVQEVFMDLMNNKTYGTKSRQSTPEK